MSRRQNRDGNLNSFPSPTTICSSTIANLHVAEDVAQRPRHISSGTRESVANESHVPGNQLHANDAILETTQREREYYQEGARNLEQIPLWTPWSAMPHNFSQITTILQDLYQAEDPLFVDLSHIESEACQELIPRAHRQQISSLAKTHTFRNWATTSQQPTKVLIHGSFEGAHPIYALSHFCATFLWGVRETSPSRVNRRRFSTLAFFCGRHLEGSHAGGLGMIKSLVTQLLRQHQFDIRHMPMYVHVGLLERGDLRQLRALFVFLLGQIHDVTIYCVIDGVNHFEGDDHINDMTLVLGFLLNLTLNRWLSCTFKVMVTSSSPTRVVQQAFSPAEIISLDPNTRISEQELQMGIGETSVVQ